MLLDNFYQYLRISFGGGSANFKDTEGHTQSVSLWEYCRSWCNTGTKGDVGMYANSPEANIDYGIVVGTSDIEPTPSDYRINKIPHGSSSGQLYYYPTQVKNIVVSGNTIELEITRDIANQSGGDIDVKEYGLIVKIREYYFLIIREVSPTTVPAGGLLQVSFKFRTTV